MSVMSWCRQTAAIGFRQFLRPLVFQSRADSTAPTLEGKESWTRRWGYEDRYSRRGLLAHNDEFQRVTVLRKYIPKEPWLEKKALYGQNDYIDILGSGEIHPVQTHYKIPRWIRGFNGNELAVLIRKRKFLSKRLYAVYKPTKWNSLNKRIKYLYTNLNIKTKTPLVTRKKL